MKVGGANNPAHFSPWKPMEQTTTVPPGLQLALLDCYELGKSLRSGDADAFCEIYDSLVLMENPQDGANLQFKFSAIKEAARQISELSQEDYITLECCHTSSTQNNDLSFDIYEPIAIQLSTIVDQLKQGGACTSDSGALSDYEESLCETEELKSEGSSLVALCSEETEDREPQLNCQLETELETDQGDDEGISNGHTVTDIDITTPSSEITAAISPHTQENSCTTSTNTNEEKDITTLLSKIKSMSPEELSPCSRAEYDREACNGDVIMVTDLEKELFSDSSAEDVSPEKDKRGEIIAQEKSSRHQEEKSPGNTEGEPPKEESKWHRGGYSNRHTYRRGRHKNRGFRPHRGGGGGGGGGGRDRYNRPKENSPTEVQNGGPEVGEMEDGNTEERNETFGHLHHHGKRDHNKVYSDPEKREHEIISHQPSPLVIHSQNMWSGNTHKTFNKRERSTHRQHNHTLSPGFNHYEVGCFLMEGWEQAKDRLIRIASTSS